MKRKKILATLIWLMVGLVFHAGLSSPVWAQTFGPTCSPTPGAPVATSTPTLPVTAGSTATTWLIFGSGAIFIFGSFGLYRLLVKEETI